MMRSVTVRNFGDGLGRPKSNCNYSCSRFGGLLILALLHLIHCFNCEASESNTRKQYDFDEYEVHGSIQLHRIIIDEEKKILVRHFFSVYVKNSEWSIVVSENSSRDSLFHLKKPMIHWYGNGSESVFWKRLDDSDHDNVDIYPLKYPISEGDESTAPLLWVMFASRGFSANTGSQKMPLLHDFQARLRYWEFHELNVLRTNFSSDSSFPSNVVFLNDIVPLESRKLVDQEDSKLWDSMGRRRPGVYFNKYRVPGDVHPTNCWYRAFPPKVQNGQSIPTGFEVSFWDSCWGCEPRLVLQGEAEVQQFSNNCSLKDLRPVIHREVVVGEMRQWAAQPQGSSNDQSIELPTYLMRPGEDWPTLEESMIRLKQPNPDRQPRRQPWGFILIGVIVGVPFAWGLRRAFRRA
jgi:hypothetical protein